MTDMEQTVCVYKYFDENGKVVAVKKRLKDKSFRWILPNGSVGLNGLEPPLYNLYALTVRVDEPVFAVEGEKDADNLMKAGLLAVSPPHGAGSWSPEYNYRFEGREVYIIPDNDKPGIEHAEAVAKNLRGVAKSVKIVQLEGLPEHGDSSDWLAQQHGLPEANGRNLVCSKHVCPVCSSAAEKLLAMAEKAPEWEPPQDPELVSPEEELAILFGERFEQEDTTTPKASATTAVGVKSGAVAPLESPLQLAERIRRELSCGRPNCACRRGRLLHCPAHDDEHPSLSVDVKGGMLLVKCHGPCSQEAVIEELRRRGLWFEGRPKTGLVRREVKPASAVRIKKPQGQDDKKSIGELVHEAMGILGDTGQYFVYGREVVRVEKKKSDKQPELWLDCVKRENIEELLTTGEFGEISQFASRIAKFILAKPLSEIQDYLPTIERFASNPLVLPSGEVIAKQGFYRENCVYMAKSVDLPKAPDTPEECVEKLLEPFSDFPFTGEADKANLLALILTPLIGLFTEQKPLFLVEAAKEGTGKSLLVKTALYIAYGEGVPAQNAPQDDEEWRKLITTAVSQAWNVLFVDNVGKKLDSSALSAYATAVRWQDRILGKNEGGVWPCHALVVCTGNNPDTSGEIARRVVPIRIEADCERPEERSGFRYPNLLEHVAQNRLEYLSCALKLISLWVKAGKPEPREAPAFGSFEEWRAVVGGILEFAGVRGFLANQREAKERLAEETSLWREFVQKWYGAYGNGYVNASKLLPLAEEAGLVEEGVSARRFGRLLAKHDGRVYGEYKIRYRQSYRDYYLGKPRG
jgi:hypothetical protein